MRPSPLKASFALALIAGSSCTSLGSVFPAAQPPRLRVASTDDLRAALGPTMLFETDPSFRKHPIELIGKVGRAARDPRRRPPASFKEVSYDRGRPMYSPVELTAEDDIESDISWLDRLDSTMPASFQEAEDDKGTLVASLILDQNSAGSLSALNALFAGTSADHLCIIEIFRVCDHRGSHDELRAAASKWVADKKLTSAQLKNVVKVDGFTHFRIVKYEAKRVSADVAIAPKAIRFIAGAELYESSKEFVFLETHVFALSTTALQPSI